MSDRSIKDVWCAALRSGTYRQGRYRLNNWLNDEYCAIGVLRIELGESAAESLLENRPDVFWGAIHLNDIDKVPFGKIADWIEERL